MFCDCFGRMFSGLVAVPPQGVKLRDEEAVWRLLSFAAGCVEDYVVDAVA